MISGQPLVSVLIVNYNYEPYLREAIDSALGQSYDKVEVVVVDDGSTDRSRDVIDSYGNQVTAVYQDNGGSVSATHTGLDVVRGEIVVLLDADDVLFPDVVERVVPEFAADPRCGRVQWRLVVLDESGQSGGTQVPPVSWPLPSGDLSGRVMRHRLFRFPPTSGNAWSTRILRGVPRAPDEIFFYVDRWYGELVALAAPVRSLDAPGGYYRVHASSHHVKQGVGERYFRERIALTERLHTAGASVAAERGLAGYPRDVFEPLDAAFLTWHLAMHKLTGQPPARPLWWLAGRGAYAALSQPEQPLRSRASRAAWFCGLAVLPPRSRAAGRLIALRYDRGD